MTTKSLENQISFKVKPTVLTMEQAINKGHYNDHFTCLKNDINTKVFRETPKNLPEEEIVLGVIPNGEYIQQGKVAEYWEQFGLELVPHSYAYLAQLMIDVPEAKMPKKLAGKHLLAYEGTPSFRLGDGTHCSLYVSRDDARRGLHMAYEHDGWIGYWCFVLRKITSSPSTLTPSLSDTLSFDEALKIVKENGCRVYQIKEVEL